MICRVKNKNYWISNWLVDPMRAALSWSLCRDEVTCKYNLQNVFSHAISRTAGWCRAVDENPSIFNKLRLRLNIDEKGIHAKW